MHSEKCPICSGSGQVKDTQPCYGCDGRGWIEVNDFPKNKSCKVIRTTMPYEST